MPDTNAPRLDPGAPPITRIEITGLAKRFGKTVALDGLSLTLEPGVTGLLGPNGAGKTTLLRILATVLAADAGEVRYGGQLAAGPEALHEIRSELGYAPQEPGFYPNFTVFQFIDYLAILKEMTDRRSRQDEVRRVISLVGLDEVAGRPIRKLSGGMRRRTALAQALLGDPTLVVLDEPTAGLDPEQRLRFRELLSKRSPDQIVLLSTHQTEDVTALCQQVIVVDHGRTLFNGAPADLASTGAGRVWISDHAEPTAQLSWIDGLGRHRHVGEPPPGAEITEPTLEDGYLLLVGRHPDAEADGGPNGKAA